MQKEDILARIGRLVATFLGVEALHDVYGSIPGEGDPFLTGTEKRPDSFIHFIKKGEEGKEITIVR
ncbi:MAG: hypothetical protein QHH04_02370 [Methanolinea sp.]|nr:hypothetical protein [Methanolinea sp.]